MVHINKNLGGLSVNNLASAKGTQTKKEDEPKFKTEVEPLKIYKWDPDDKAFTKIWDDGKIDQCIYLNDDNTFIREGKDPDAP